MRVVRVTTPKRIGSRYMDLAAIQKQRCTFVRRSDGVEFEVRTVSPELRVDESSTLAYGQQRPL
jgi:hypothetical protein